MPTARELLEQADALMRRNRAAREEPAQRNADVLQRTDAIAADTPEAQPRPETVAADSLDDVPLLTDVVAEIEASTTVETVEASDDASQALESIRGEEPITGPLLDWQAEARPQPAEHELNVPPVPGAEVEDDQLALDEVEAPASVAPETPSASAALASALALGAVHGPHEAPPIPTDDDDRWDALAEDIRMQVLQRIDIFTDTGLREQLTARLQPIVDRASADLVATINQHVGQLLRAYVAEAIEREIDKWRHGG